MVIWTCLSRLDGIPLNTYMYFQFVISIYRLIWNFDLQRQILKFQDKTRIVCIRLKGRTQCIFPRPQHSYLYVYMHWPKVNLYQVVVGQQSVRTCKCFCFFKWPPVAILDVQKSLCILPFQINTTIFILWIFLQNGCRRPSHLWPFHLLFFIKWPPEPISNVRNSLSIVFLAILDRYATLICFEIFENGCRRPFWMSEIQFRSHFWPFQIDRPFWISEIHFR